MAKHYMLSLSVFICTLISLTSAKPNGVRFSRIIRREEWGAKPPTAISKLPTPTPNVVIHHTSTPAACFNKEDCLKAMRSMQYTHQTVNKWADIGYNFAVGSDGLVYEGRGWNRLGAHSLGFNTQSLGIVLIGHWVSELPPEIQLNAAKQLISEGVQAGWISPKYSLVGHRQVRDTECPGEALYQEISTWKHFDASMQLVKH